MTRRASLLLLLLAAMPRPGLAEVPSLEAHASKTEVSVGEAFMVEIEALAPAGTTWSFPTDAGSGAVEMKKVDAPADAARSASPAPTVLLYQATVFALGEVAVPPLTARYRLSDGTEGEASTVPIRVRVISLLPRDPQERKLADIRSPVGLSVGRVFWIALSLALVLAGALGFFLWRRRRTAEGPAEEVMTLAPDAEAQAALARLEASGLLQRGELKAFYIELAETAKRYLERRLGAPILEMTSAETLAALRESVHASVVLAPVRSLVNAADPVKFAGAGGDAGEARDHLEAVKLMIASLEARLAPPVEEKVA